jgi:hypothetical protein
LTASFVSSPTIDNIVANTFLDTFSACSICCFHNRLCDKKNEKLSILCRRCRRYAFGFCCLEMFMRMKIEKEIRKIAFTLFSRRQIPFRSEYYTAKATTNVITATTTSAYLSYFRNNLERNKNNRLESKPKTELLLFVSAFRYEIVFRELFESFEVSRGSQAQHVPMNFVR